MDYRTFFPFRGFHYVVRIILCNPENGPGNIIIVDCVPQKRNYLAHIVLPVTRETSDKYSELI